MERRLALFYSFNLETQEVERRGLPGLPLNLYVELFEWLSV